MSAESVAKGRPFECRRSTGKAPVGYEDETPCYHPSQASCDRSHYQAAS